MIKMSLIVLCGLAATALLGNRSAALRHWVLAAAIVCAAATPLLERVVPVWHLPVNASLLGRRVEPLAVFIPIHEREIAGADDGDGQTRFVPVQPATTLRLLGPIWLAGLGISLTLLLAGFARLAWLASRSQRVVNPTWIAVADAVSHAVRAAASRAAAAERSSDAAGHVGTAPAEGDSAATRRATGPRTACGSSSAHELAHIRRGDWIVQIAAELLRAVYWFNPLIWIACRRLRRESEHACDDAVLGLGVEGTEYASHLLELARAFRQHRHTFLPAPAMARPSSLERRVSAMLNRSLNRTPLTARRLRRDRRRAADRGAAARRPRRLRAGDGAVLRHARGHRRPRAARHADDDRRTRRRSRSTTRAATATATSRSRG